MLRFGISVPPAGEANAAQTGDESPASAQRMTTYGIDGEAAQSPADEGDRSILRRPTARGAATPAAPTVAIDLHRIPNLLPQRRGTGNIAGPSGNKATKKFFQFYEREIADELQPVSRDT
jgi:hypothetical protein